MVMEAPPTPQIVGREFVRQYYTLLNQAPTHLHRFYNQQSSFVHGGLDPLSRESTPVIGQKQIHQKIQQLNFRDCHAKITQMDSQATLDNGVVVQVNGELSNDGQPMRRFTQTFVLAAQSPKMYYVHNDIFRYQDIISDEECDNETRSEPEEEIPAEREVVQGHINQPVVTPYYQAPLPPHVMPQVNGAMHPEDMMPPTGPPHRMLILEPQPQVSQPNLVANIPPQTTTPIEEPQVLEENVEDVVQESFVPEQEQEVEQETPQETISNEPKTYANLLKSGSINVPYHSPPHKNLQQMDNISPPNNSYNLASRNNSNSRSEPGNNGTSGGRLNQTRVPSNRGPPLGTGNRYEDGTQLFVGSIPTSAPEEDLHEIFGEFGQIIELKVYTKYPKPGMPSNRPPQTYAFLRYKTQESMQKCLNARPIYYPQNDTNGTSLTVEKRSKERVPYGGAGGGAGGGGRPNLDNRGRGENNGPRRSLGGNLVNNRPQNVGGPVGPNRNNQNYRPGGPPNRAAGGANTNTYNRR